MKRRTETNYVDENGTSLLKAIAVGLEESPAGFEQHFNFQIRDKTISGTLKVIVNEVRS